MDNSHEFELISETMMADVMRFLAIISFALLIIFIPLVQIMMDQTPPSVPLNITASAVSDSQIEISWDNSTDNVNIEGYKIFRDGMEIDLTNKISFVDSSLASSKDYCYTVSAFDASGNESKQSDQACAKTLKDKQKEQERLRREELRRKEEERKRLEMLSKLETQREKEEATRKREEYEKDRRVEEARRKKEKAERKRKEEEIKRVKAQKKIEMQKIMKERKSREKLRKANQRAKNKKIKTLRFAEGALPALISNGGIRCMIFVSSDTTNAYEVTSIKGSDVSIRQVPRPTVTGYGLDPEAMEKTERAFNRKYPAMKYDKKKYYFLPSASMRVEISKISSSSKYGLYLIQKDGRIKYFNE